MIFLIEGILLVISLEKEEKSLTNIQQVEYQRHGSNSVISDYYIQRELASYKSNIMALTFVICLLLIIGFLVIYNLLIGRHLKKLTYLNKNFKDVDLKLYPLHSIPNDEMGDLIKSRIEMVKSMRSQINENKKLVRILTHDLNNSLFVILSHAKKIEKKSLDMDKSDILKRVQKIKIAAESQNELITKIMGIDALQSSKESIRLESHPLKELVLDSTILFSEKLNNKHIKIDYLNKDDNDFFITIDKVLFFNNILNNLISNSIKFSKENSKIIISSRTLENGTKVIEFRDYGIGMGEDLLSKLFMPNEKTSRLGTAGEKGTGFGMPLLKETMLSLKGEVSVESSEDILNHGTIFTLMLSA